MGTKIFALTALVGTGMLLASSPTATAALDNFGFTFPNNDPSPAQTYDFTFTSSGMDATGMITIQDGVAISGSINVTGIPIEHPGVGDPTAVTIAGVPLLLGSGVAKNLNGDDLPYDNIVSFANNPILTGNGLDFGSGPNPQGLYNPLVGLWGGDVYGNPVPDEYTLFVGEAGVHADGTPDNEYVYADVSGSLTLTPAAVPEPTTIIAGALMILPLGASVLRILRKRQGT